MRVLVTGGAGFIGSWVVDKLLEQNNIVLVVDNYKTGVSKNNIAHTNLSIVNGTISNLQFLTTVFQQFKPDVVLHAAASYIAPENWQDDTDTNITGTINVVNCCKAVNVKRIVYLQTSLCYGLKPIQNPITLTHPLFSGSYNGGSSYAISKTAAEQYVALSGINFVSLRLANVYGPRNLSGPLPTFYQRLANNLPCTIINTRRDFIYITDVVNVVVKSISGMGNGYYQVATGKDYSIKELYQLTLKYTNIKDADIIEKPLGNDDVKTILLDPSKTQTDFNWSIQTLFEDGVKQTIQWYKNNPITKTYTHLKNIN